MHYYQHNIGDYRRDTAHLSLLEHGIYRTLLDLYYLTQTPIPKETDWVIRRLSAKTNEEILGIQAVLKDFFVECKEGYRHKRCDIELREYTAKADTARSNGKLGGRPKKTQPVILGNPDATDDKANHKPLTINQEPIGREKAAFAAESFTEFWRQYPKKTGKADAEKAWKKISLNAGLLKQIHAGLCVAKATRQWTDEQGKYIPNPATWLNGKRWEDEGAEVEARNDAFAGLL